MDRTLDSVPTGEYFSFPQFGDKATPFTGEELMTEELMTEELMTLLGGKYSWALRQTFAEGGYLTPLEDLARLRPEQLPGIFLAHGVFSPDGWQTDHGSWKPKKVSSVGDMVGVKTTLEFKPNKGTKVDIGKMAIYNSLVPHADGLFMDESSALCCVFPKGKGPASDDPCKDFVAPPLPEWKEHIRSNFDATKCCPIDVKDYGVGGSKKRQRGGGSEYWEGYTKIYTIDPDRMYAACHGCTTMLKLKADSGTGSQRNHNRTCLFKKQLSIGISMNTPAIALGNSSQDT